MRRAATMVPGAAECGSAVAARQQAEGTTVRAADAAWRANVDMPASHIEVTEDIEHVFGGLGSRDRGFDPAAYLETLMGQWALSQMSNVISGVDQQSDEAMEHWRALGMEKTYFPGDGRIKEWSLFVPSDATEGEELPLMVVMHAGGTDCYFAEVMGFVEDAARERYVVACPSWAADGLTDEQQAAYEASGMPHYESHVFAEVLSRIEELVPVDATRVYCAGISGGGNACGYVAMDCPELIAGFSPATGAAIQSDGGGSLRRLAGCGAGMVMAYGTYDAEERWPIVGDPVEIGPVSTYLTPEERLANVNGWVEACGGRARTECGDVEALAAEGGTVTGDFGLAFDATFDKEYETRYSFGDVANVDGQAVVRFMAVEGCPHFVSPEWAAEVYHFLSRFSRDAATGKLVIAG